MSRNNKKAKPKNSRNGNGKRKRNSRRPRAPRPNLMVSRLQVAKTAAPVALSSITASAQKAAPPMIVQREEYFTDSRSTVATVYTQSSYSINAGFTDLFPWLAQIATSWEYYTITSMTIHYRSMCPTTTPGTIAFCIDTDNYDTAPVSMQSLAQMVPSVMSNVWQSFSFKVPEDILRVRNRGRMLTRNGAVGGDVNNYDVGRLFIAYEDHPANTALGRWWIDYSIRLEVPQQSDDVASFHLVANSALTVPMSTNVAIYNGSTTRVARFDASTIRFFTSGTFWVVAIAYSANITGIAIASANVNVTIAASSSTGVALTSRIAMYKVTVPFISVEPADITIVLTAGTSNPGTFEVFINSVDPQLAV